MDLANHLNRGIDGLFRRALGSAPRPREALFLLRLALLQRRAAARRRKNTRGGEAAPAFLIASVATACNLRCAGCYAHAQAGQGNPQGGPLSAARWGELFAQAQELGVSFVLLAGGEPLTRPDVLERAAKTPGVVFPVFTNGTLFDAAALSLFARHRNLVPVCSLEGGPAQTDARRGPGTWARVSGAFDAFHRRGLFFGVSITVTAENLRAVTDEAFVAGLRARGCGLFLFVEYVPADAEAPMRPLDAQKRADLAGRLDALKARFGTAVFVSFPGDEEAAGGCLAAGRGFFHINAAGGAEPCPFAPASDVSLRERPLRDALDSPLFTHLRQSGMLALAHTGGCALFGRLPQPAEGIAPTKDAASAENTSPAEYAAPAKDAALAKDAAPGAADEGFSHTLP